MDKYKYFSDIVSISWGIICSWYGIGWGTLILGISGYLFVIDDSGMTFFTNFRSEIAKKYRRVSFCFVFTLSIAVCYAQYIMYSNLENEKMRLEEKLALVIKPKENEFDPNKISFRIDGVNINNKSKLVEVWKDKYVAVSIVNQSGSDLENVKIKFNFSGKVDFDESGMTALVYQSSDPQELENFIILSCTKGKQKGILYLTSKNRAEIRKQVYVICK